MSKKSDWTFTMSTFIPTHQQAVAQRPSFSLLEPLGFVFTFFASVIFGIILVTFLSTTSCHCKLDLLLTPTAGRSDWHRRAVRRHPDKSAKDKSANDTTAKPTVRRPTVRKGQQCEWHKSANVKCANFSWQSDNVAVCTASLMTHLIVCLRLWCQCRSEGWIQTLYSRRSRWHWGTLSQITHWRQNKEQKFRKSQNEYWKWQMWREGTVAMYLVANNLN